MPMELYSSEALVRDLANAISESEGKPLNIGGNTHKGIDRDYAFRLISDTKRAVEGHAATGETPASAKAAARAATARSAAIRRAIAKADRDAKAKKPATTRAPRRAKAAE